MKSNPFDSLQSRISGFLNAKGLENLENPLVQLIKQSLQDMEFVSLEEFGIQREVLNRLREKVKTLEEKVSELEKNAQIKTQEPPQHHIE